MGNHDPKTFFLKPEITAHRKYEALRAYYVDKLPKKELAERFGYTLSSFETMIKNFRHRKIIFFHIPMRGPKERRVPENIREKIVSLRKMNLSIIDIKDELTNQGYSIGQTTIDRILKDEGFARLPKRAFVGRGLTDKGATVPQKAVALDIGTIARATMDCQVAGLFFFVPYIIKSGLQEVLEAARLPKTIQLSSLNSAFSILAMKLIGQERLSQINHYNFDEGFGFFAGLNVPPKSTCLSTYSYLAHKNATHRLMKGFVSRVRTIDEDLYDGSMINLDFHSIPHYGEESVMEDIYVSSRNRAMKGATTFFAQDADSKVLNYCSADIKRTEMSDEILNFVKYWIDVKGIVDQTLVFDSKLTSYSVLSQLNRDGVKFITLRRRGKDLVKEAFLVPKDKWTTVTVDIPKRKFPKFMVLERKIELKGYEGKVRQMIIWDNGRQEPTFMITNDFDIGLTDLATNYARRWRIENTLSDLVHFFNLNALSSPIMIRIHFDVTMTVIADTLYKLLAKDLRGFENCTAKQLFGRFINAPGKIFVDGDNITVQFRKRAHTPILRTNETLMRPCRVPWLGNKVLRYKWTP
jgi:transposase